MGENGPKQVKTTKHHILTTGHREVKFAGWINLRMRNTFVLR